MKRLENESFSDYKLRRRVTQRLDALKAKGRMIWNSGRNGTYMRKIHGDLR